jgi:hypothetical protein
MFGAVLVMICASPTQATVAVGYSYDSLGRLVQTCQSQIGSAFLSNYTLDPAGNRTTLNSSNPVFTLGPGQEMHSADQRFTFSMQSDGNLVLYAPTGYLWASNTYGNPGAYLAFQNDGNLVIYKGDSSGSIWNSATQSNCARLVVQNDGNVVIYSAAGPSVWSTNTGGH